MPDSCRTYAHETQLLARFGKAQENIYHRFRTVSTNNILRPNCLSRFKSHVNTFAAGAIFHPYDAIGSEHIGTKFIQPFFKHMFRNGLRKSEDERELGIRGDARKIALEDSGSAVTECPPRSFDP